MGRTFITADWHLGDPRRDILGRPFADADAMRERLVAEHNALVSPQDTVYVVGDALYRDAPEQARHLDDFNGRKTLLRGNHDVLDDAVYERYFERVVAEGEGLALDVAGVACWLTHYPTRSRADRFNLIGHIHGSWRVQRNMLNVGVDAHHFRPVTPEQVAFYLQAITSFYDADVWVADHPANTAHSGRGKTNSYFTGH